MARDGHGDWIRGARPGYGAAGRGPSNRLRYGPVGARLPERNRLQIQPNAPLESRRLNVQRKRRMKLHATHLLEQGLLPAFEVVVVPAAAGEGKFPLQSLFKFLIGVRELDCTNSVV